MRARNAGASYQPRRHNRRKLKKAPRYRFEDTDAIDQRSGKEPWRKHADDMPLNDDLNIVNNVFVPKLH